MINMTTLIKSLTQIPGISGAESPIAQELHKYIQPYCDLCEIDSFGNVTGFIRSANPHAKTLMLEAHMDQIGMMVSEIQSDGLVSFVNLGGIDPRILPGAEVLILAGRKYMELCNFQNPGKIKLPTQH